MDIWCPDPQRWRYRVSWPEQAMSRGVCWTRSVTSEEKQSDHWGHAMEVELKTLMEEVVSWRPTRCSPSHCLFPGTLEIGIYQPPLWLVWAFIWLASGWWNMGRVDALQFPVPCKMSSWCYPRACFFPSLSPRVRQNKIEGAGHPQSSEIPVGRFPIQHSFGLWQEWKRKLSCVKPLRFGECFVTAASIHYADYSKTAVGEHPREKVMVMH